ncbi:MAG: DUF58 domain-containing protein [Nanoarchaeota archaeon]
MPVKELRLNLVPEKHYPVGAKRDILSKVLEGNFTTLFKGKGMEFAGFREYTYFDDANLIDWAASLRSNKILIREFEVQKSFNVFLLLDVSDKMLFCSTRKNKLKVEHAADLVSRIAYATVRTNNAVGMAMFNDRLVSRIYPEIGYGMILRINKELSNPNNYGGRYDLKKVIQYVNSFLKTKCLIIIVSDFIGLERGWGGYMKNLMVNHEVIGMMLRDPRDEEFPDLHAQFELEDPFSTERLLVDTEEYARPYAKEALDEESGVINAFGQQYFSFLKLRTDQNFYDPIIRFLKKRAQVYKNV